MLLSLKGNKMEFIENSQLIQNRAEKIRKHKGQMRQKETN